MAGDLNSIVFKSENSVAMEKDDILSVRICLLDHFPQRQKLEYNFPLGTIFWPIFPVRGGIPLGL